MRVAGSVIDITPRKPLPLAGYSGRPDPFATIASELEANLLLIEEGDLTIALVAIDALFASDALERRILEALGQPDLVLILVASHTHSAPGLDDRKPVLGRLDHEHLSLTAGRIAEGIRAAIASLAEAPGLHYGFGRAAGGINRRRRWLSLGRRFPFARIACVMAPNAAAETAAQVQSLSLGPDPAKPRAIIWSWPCHAVATPDRDAVSADFPGEVRRRLRRHFAIPDLPVLYLPGFCGDIRPDFRGARYGLGNILRCAFLPITPFGPATRATYDELCEGLAASVLDSTRAAKPVAQDGPVLHRKGSVSLRDQVEPPQDLDMGVSLLAFGGAVFLLAGAEVCSPYYEFLGSDPARPLFLSGYTGPVFGYLPSEKQRKEGGYEAGGFFGPFGLKGRFRPGVEQAFLEAVRALDFKAIAGRARTPEGLR